MPPILVKHALVVDASSELRTLLAQVLPHGLWTITYAPSNKQAMHSLLQKPYDLVLTSEKTSALADVDLLRKIRSIRPHTRLIILAPESTPSDVLDSIRAHAFSFFSAPFNLERLGEMIASAIAAPAWDDGIEILSATPEWIRLSARCDVQTAERLIQFMKEIAELPQAESERVGVAFREMLMNAIEHGGQLDPHNSIEIEYVRARHMVACRIADPGPGFTLDEIPHAAIAHDESNPIAHMATREQLGMRPGGYGILMAQKLVDELIYNQDGNEVLLVKYLDPQPATA
jgi:anti-sigma regulatory factor (Ser/Thr protein kinase)